MGSDICKTSTNSPGNWEAAGVDFIAPVVRRPDGSALAFTQDEWGASIASTNVIRSSRLLKKSSTAAR